MQKTHLEVVLEIVSRFQRQQICLNLEHYRKPLQQTIKNQIDIDIDIDIVDD